MYKVTLKPEKGKSYDVGGTIFKAAVTRTVSEKLGKYLKNNDSFDVIDADQLDAPEDDVVNPQGIEPKKSDNLPVIYSEEELNKMNKAEQEQVIFILAGDKSSVKNETERIALILQLQEELTKPEGE